MEEISNDDKIALRKKQWELAMKGDTRLLIWMGKNYLGQSESPMVIKEDLCEGFDLREIGSVCEQCGDMIEEKTMIDEIRAYELTDDDIQS